MQSSSGRRIRDQVCPFLEASLKFFFFLCRSSSFFNDLLLLLTKPLRSNCTNESSSAGLSLLQFCNLNSFRTKFILGFSFFMGFSVPQYFREYELVAGHFPVHTGSTAFNDMVSVIFLSQATVAVIVAVFLDCTLHYGDSAIRRDSGFHWWEKFRYFKTDTRSEEFYSLPYSLNKFFPSV